jgi:hypothetical protein
MNPGIEEEEDDRAEALEQDEEAREDGEVNENGRATRSRKRQPQNVPLHRVF